MIISGYRLAYFGERAKKAYFIDIEKNKLVAYESDKTFYNLNRGKIVYDELNENIFCFGDDYYYRGNKDKNQVFGVCDVLPPYYYAGELVHGYCKNHANHIPVSIIDIIKLFYASLD